MRRGVSSFSAATAAVVRIAPTSARTWEREHCVATTSKTIARSVLRVVSLTDNTPYILAWANDEGFDRVFAEQLKNLASSGDLLIAVSGSGNSPNVLRAVEWANRNGLDTFGCTGFSGGKLRALAKQCLHVPLDDMGIVESIHLSAFHWVVDNIHARIN